MKIGLLITTYNRPDYLRQCLESLEESNLSDVEIVIIDDHSTDYKVFEIIEHNNISYKVFKSIRNNGIHMCAMRGFDMLMINYKCDALINLDPDTIVKPDFIQRLADMLLKHPDKIVTGFNTTTGGRHKPVSYFDGGVYKRTIGGVNMCMTAETYKSIVRPCLVATNWDWRVCEAMQKENKYFVALSPSVVQHIGFVSSMGHYDGGVDVAEDF
jgi:GT2 family glycosyltransferase